MNDVRNKSPVKKKMTIIRMFPMYATLTYLIR